MINLPQKQALVFLAAVEGIGSATLSKLVDWSERNAVPLNSVIDHPQLFPVFQNSDKLRENIRQLKSIHTVSSYWNWLKKQKIAVVHSQESTYPFLLKQTANHPTLLYFMGNQQLFQSEKCVAVVGTRQATAYGKRATQVIVRDLIRLGATIVSGFMYGIDIIAHQVAINAGGATIAVLGFGFGQMFPSSHQIVFERFLAGGNTLFVSQFAPGIPATPGNFPARNYVVAGLSLATIVVEAADQSGSLITAAAALDEGRVVCAVSGPFDSQYSQGTKSLLNQGAVVVSSGIDIFNELGIQHAQNNKFSQQERIALLNDLNPKQKELVSLISGGVRLPDELASQLTMSVEELSLELTQLEILNILRREQDGWVIV